MKILTVAFMLLFNYLDTLPKLHHLVFLFLSSMDGYLVAQKCE